MSKTVEKTEEFYDYYNNHDNYRIPQQLLVAYPIIISTIERTCGIKLFQFQKEMIFNIMCSRKSIKRKDPIHGDIQKV